MQASPYLERSSELKVERSSVGRYEALKRELDPDRFLRIARDVSGLSDFGDERFLEPYRKLLDCVARDVDFSDEGLESFKGNVVRCLVNKLRIRRDFLSHPEIRDEVVDDPIVVIGLPRTGTTKMQRILSSLPASEIQRPLLWQLLNPAPFPDAVPGRPDPRIAAAGMSGITSDGRPDYEAAHLAAPAEPEEDVIMCDSTFDDWVWSSIFAPSLSYHDWVVRRPHLSNYEHLRDMYKYLQWQGGGRRGRIWVTKNVQHIAYLDELLTCFPKATLVHCHRAPHDSIPSLAKLSLAIWAPILKTTDPVFAGRAVFKWWRLATDRYMEARGRLRLDGRIIDVPYDRIRNDAINVCREVYHRAGRPLSSEQLSAIARWDADNEQHKHGRHSYSLAEFGLSAAEIDSAFKDYIDRFIT
ncbi:MAG: sulfotransferase [Caulobacteraceae bacterium]|nr:sulfotransferase [Caulobacteraceae bacterium]